MYNEKFDQYEMNQLSVSGDIPIQEAVRNVALHGKRELYANVGFHGWVGLEADVYDYVIHATSKGYVKIFGQEVPAYTIRDKEGNIIGFEVRLGV